MDSIQELNISQELKKCVESMPEDIRYWFDYYCLGIRGPLRGNEYTLDEYIEMIRMSLIDQSSYDKRFVVYKALNKNNDIITPNIWKSDVRDFHSSATRCIKKFTESEHSMSSCYVTAGHRNLQFKNTFESLEYNTGIVFLIHPDVLSIDNYHIEKFAAYWNAYYFNNVVNELYPNVDFLFFFGNRKIIRSGNRPPTHAEVKANKLNLSMNIPVNCLAYEKE